MESRPFFFLQNGSEAILSEIVRKPEGIGNVYWFYSSRNEAKKKQTEKASLDGLERQTEISVKIQTYLTEEQL